MKTNFSITSAPPGYEILKLQKSGPGFYIKREAVVQFGFDQDSLHIDAGKLASNSPLVITMQGIQLPRSEFDFMALRHPDGKVDDWSTGATVASEEAWLDDASHAYGKLVREHAELRASAGKVFNRLHAVCNSLGEPVRLRREKITGCAQLNPEQSPSKATLVPVEDPAGRVWAPINLRFETADEYLELLNRLWRDGGAA